MTGARRSRGGSCTLALRNLFPSTLRFLFVTIQGFESDFYARVGAEIGRHGHEVHHLTVSRRAARRLRERGEPAIALPDLIAQLAPCDLHAEIDRIEKRYALATIREVYRADPACTRMSEEAALTRAVEHVRALERVFDELQPDVLLPEVGRETIRTIAHRIALDRGAPTLFPFYTIFPQPLRLYVDTMQAPIVPVEALRPLTPEERSAVDAFRTAFIALDTPIRAHRRLGPTRRRVRRLVEYTRAKLGEDRQNEYLHPFHWARESAAAAVRAVAARRLYVSPGDRPFVYFPLHDTEDYKIKQLLPHLADQVSIVDQVAYALPPGVDLVIKEHPQTIGRNRLDLLRRLSREPNVRLVDPRTSTHDLVRRSQGVTVIGSTVGLEALLHGKGVLTLGNPFYAGYGITIDLLSVTELPEGIPTLLAFQPDPETVERFLHAAMQACYPGAPVLADDSAANAIELAQSFVAVAAAVVSQRPLVPR